MSVGPFGPWQAIERIGMGAFGVTWRCRHAEHAGREAAVKVLLDEHRDHPSYVERFRAEAMLLRNLMRSPHPNLAGFEGCDPSPEGPRWLALSYVPGMDLSSCLRDELLPDGTRLGTTAAARHELAVQVGRAVSAAVSHAHARGIAHRDIKPSNIRMTPDGGVVLLDFGIGRDARITRLTGTGQSSPHTITYAAPEILKGDLIEDAWLGRVDVYSLGVLLYELLEGRAPDIAVVSTENGSLRVAARSEALVPSAMFTPQVVRIVSEMTHPDPTRRPDMASVHAQLARLPELDAGPRRAAPMPAPLHKERVAAPTLTLSDENTRKTMPEDQDWQHIVTPPVGFPEPIQDSVRPDARTVPAPVRVDRAPEPRRPHQPAESSRSIFAFPPLVIGILMAIGVLGGWWWSVRDKPIQTGPPRDVVNAYDMARIEQLCGNGTVDPAEECDDGNTIADDGCTECKRDGGLLPPTPTPKVATRPKPKPKPKPAPFPPADDKQLQAYVKSAGRSGFDKLIAHINANPGWLGGFSAASVTAVVDTSIRKFGGKRPTAPQKAVASILSGVNGGSCGKATLWLKWAYGSSMQRSAPFYKTWCTKCTEQFPPLPIGKHACGAVDGYQFRSGKCVSPAVDLFADGC